MSTFVAPGAKVTVVDDGFRRLADRARHRLPAETAELAAAKVQRAYATIVGVWPVRSGRSLRGWRVDPAPGGAALANPVDYVADVHPAALGGALALDAIVQPAVAQAQAELVEELPAVVLDTLRGRR